MMPPLAQFADAARGDLHLTDSATAALDQGQPLADVANDLDGEPRGAMPDLGADEH